MTILAFNLSSEVLQIPEGTSVWLTSPTHLVKLQGLLLLPGLTFMFFSMWRQSFEVLFFFLLPCLDNSSSFWKGKEGNFHIQFVVQFCLLSFRNFSP